MYIDGGKSSKGDQQQQCQGRAGGGWGFSFIKYILPKKKNEAHLPDNKKPSVSLYHIPYSWKFSPGENLSVIFFSCVKDCIADMATFTALAKSLSLENYYNTKIAVLGENLIYPTKIFSYTVIMCA